jgi:ketosteroid isomerase-like protein
MSSITQPYFDLKLELSSEAGVTTTAQANRDLLVSVYQDMVSGKNPEALTEILHPDVKFYEASSLPYGGAESGPEGCAKGVQKMFSAWSELKVTFTEFATAGDIVIAYMRFAGKSRATGKIYDHPNWEMFRFKDGKVIEWRPVYWDTHEVRTVCGID